MIRVKVLNADELAGKLEHALDPVPDVIGDLGRDVVEEARIGFKPHTADKGSLAATVKLQHTPSRPLVAAVFTRAPIAEEVELGRKAGKGPSIAAVERWATAHGISTPPATLARDIRARGTRGLKAFETAARKAESGLPAKLRDLGNSIEEAWG